MEQENYPQYILELEQMLHNLFQIMKEQNSHYAAELKLSIPQFFCLFVISTGKYKMSELASFIALSYASATNLVNRLVDAGLAERYDDPDDRRVVFIEITEKGRELISNIRKKRLAKLVENCEKLSDKDKKAMVKGFSLLISQMR